MILKPVIDRIQAVVPRGQRALISVAGPPGSGKSTLAAALVTELGPISALIPMDGFHLDNRLLEPMGLLPRKGAPETFDVDGFRICLERVATGAPVYIPLFDRSREIAIAAAAEIAVDCTTVIVEGNYLLFEQQPWSSLATLWDVTIWLDIPDDVLEHRLLDRWHSHGLSQEKAQTKVRQNDLPNAIAVKTHSTPADLTLATDWRVKPAHDDLKNR